MAEATSHPQSFLTLDELLERQVGELGRGQIQLLAWASFAFIPMALLLLLMVFTSLDPVEAGLWTCVDPEQDAQVCNSGTQIA